MPAKERPLKVATPPVMLAEPPVGVRPAEVTLIVPALSPVRVLPLTSTTLTAGCVASAAPAAAVADGEVAKASAFAAPGVTVKLDVVERVPSE